MVPTIGRRVYFYPQPQHLEAGVTVYDADQPCDAGVIYVWSPIMVNLLVTDHAGNQHVMTSVEMVPPEEEPKSGHYAKWMPYQIASSK